MSIAAGALVACHSSGVQEACRGRYYHSHVLPTLTNQASERDSLVVLSQSRDRVDILVKQNEQVGSSVFLFQFSPVPYLSFIFSVTLSNVCTWPFSVNTRRTTDTETRDFGGS